MLCCVVAPCMALATHLTPNWWSPGLLDHMLSWWVGRGTGQTAGSGVQAAGGVALQSMLPCGVPLTTATAAVAAASGVIHLSQRPIEL